MNDLLYSVDDGQLQRLAKGAELRVPAGQPIRFDVASGGCWYGHGFAHRQPYPLNREPISNLAFAVNNTQSPIWLCSAGWALFADTNAELAVSFDAGGTGKLEIACASEGFVLHAIRGEDLPSAHRTLMARLNWPNAALSNNMLGDSIFCTWTQYPRCITQDRVLEMAREIRRRGYPCSTLTIDDRWESAFGELQFSKDFPDPAGMVSKLHSLGFRVLLWVTPFINQEAATFEKLGREKILVPRRDGAGPALFRWWAGTAGLVDLTNPAGRDWYRSQLMRLKTEIGIDGFKVDGGDAKYQPPVEESAWHSYRGASGYADELLSLAEEVSPGLCETRTVWLSQSRNVLWRQGGKDSHWGVDNGLKAMVSLGLHMSLMGYDAFIPDMIPGRVQTMVSDMALPTDELMVRWTEATALMPMMQFSYFPWNYGEATADAVRAYSLLHKAMEGYLVEAADNRTVPLLRPVWYDSPEVAQLYTIEDEWLLGPDLLAAPVLDENQVARDVILPPGEWLDAWTGDFVQGRILQHPAPCPGIPVFVRAENEALLETLHTALQKIRRASVPSGVTTATWQSGLDRDLSVTG